MKSVNSGHLNWAWWGTPLIFERWRQVGREFPWLCWKLGSPAPDEILSQETERQTDRKVTIWIEQLEVPTKGTSYPQLQWTKRQKLKVDSLG